MMMKKMRGLISWLMPLLLIRAVVRAQQQDPIRINSGGSSFTDDDGNEWEADQYFAGGSTNSNSNTIRETDAQSLYQTERFVDSNSMRYDIPLGSSGAYLVRLHFAEIRPYIESSGERLFDVKVENSLVYENLDIFEEAGGAYLPLVKNHVVNVEDDTLSIEFLKGSKRNPKISGIEVLPTTSNLYIDAGSEEAYTDSEGRTWQADEYFNTGQTWTNKRDISGTTNDKLYQSERYKRNSPSLRYDIPVSSPGMYLVTLHFSDNYKPMHFVGSRVFDILIEDTTVVSHLDLYKESGGFTAIQKSWLVQVDDDTLTIEFISVRQNPTIAGLEIHGLHTTAQMYNAVKPSPSPQTATFTPMYINAGSDVSVNDGVNVWEQDMYYYSGQKGSTGRTISGTPFGELYQTNRHGVSFEYEIDVPNRAYQVTLHFADIAEGGEAQGEGDRVFYVYVEGSLVLNQLDIYKDVGGYASYVVDVPTMVTDGALSIEFVSRTGQATISALAVTALAEEKASGAVEPHYAHAVPGGPYVTVDTGNDGKAAIEVDGYFSHTHLPDAWLTRWTWMVDGNVVGTNAEATTFELPVGVHNLILEVEDSGGYSAIDSTTVTVRGFGYPDITSIAPAMGDVAGGETLTILGSGFTYLEEDTTVRIGSTALTNDDIIVVNDNTIEVKKVPPGSPGIVDISVETQVGTSTSVPYTYIDETLPPIEFASGHVDDIRGPTCLAFGPDGRLYIGTQLGRIVRLTLDDDYQVIDKFVSNVVAESEVVVRVILGITFDPTETSPESPTVYVSHSWLFHKKLHSFNGKVSVVSGPNMDQMTHVVTGLPVSDHDHGINGIEFGATPGELYIQVPGNTNAGIAGSLSSTREQEEDLLSCSTVVARNVNSPDFDGDIRYDDDGNQISGLDVSVFAPGQRNSYGIILHSNGHLYATDNGANRGFGKSSVSCTEEGPSPYDPDELNVIIEGNFYGHANRRRGRTDPRQCKWRSANETSDDDYTAPIAKLPPSSNGLCEFETEHFAGQLRGNLIIGRWKGELYNVALSDDGLSTKKGTTGFPPVLIEEGALDIVQGPDGTLFTAKHSGNAIKFYSPVEATSVGLKVKSVFPRRGPENGGSNLILYGDHLYTFGVPAVTVGGNACQVHPPTSDAKLTCTLPKGTGTANIIVTAGLQSDVFRDGYRYISAGQGQSSESNYNVVVPIPTQPSPQPTSAPVLPRVEASSGTTTSLGVRDLVWINTDSIKVIGPVTSICDECFDLSIPVTIRADTWGEVNSVRMTLNGPIEFGAIEDNMPHALFGDRRWDYHGRVFEKGSYTVTAQAFSEPGGQGLTGKLVSIDFEIR